MKRIKIHKIALASVIPLIAPAIAHASTGSTQTPAKTAQLHYNISSQMSLTHQKQILMTISTIQ